MDPLSSDIEPLVLGALRNVSPRLMECEPVGATQIDQDSSGTAPTVPATPGALVEVGREPPLDQVGDTETHEDMLDALAVDLEVDKGARLEVDSVGPEDRSEERSCTAAPRATSAGTSTCKRATDATKCGATRSGSGS